MTVISAPHDWLDAELYVDLQRFIALNLYVKCEGLNFGGSIKLRTAAWMIAAAERDGLIHADSVLVESTSGNLGVALAVIAASKGLRFVCVTDQRCSPAAVQMVQALGGEVISVAQSNGAESLLALRKKYVLDLCASDARYVWLNQYENPENWISHYESTAPAIAKRFPDLDVLFVGAGTGGTVMGCARYFQEHSERAVIVAVDAVGSTNFGGEPGPRHIPGLGASELMPLAAAALVDDVVRVTEEETIRVCRLLAGRGLLLGGSSGTVIGGANAWLREHDPDQRLIAVAIAPDLGERYLDTIYDDNWVAERYGSPLSDKEPQ